MSRPSGSPDGSSPSPRRSATAPAGSSTGGERRIEVSAPAKINLFLEVLDRRPDGYHEIETVMQEIDLADRLVVRFMPEAASPDASPPGADPRVSLELHADGEPVGDIPTGPKNTVHAAATRFLERFAIRGRVRIALFKKVPSGAGLGGGSSDAAAVLEALNVLTEQRASGDELHAIAAEVGSDVPFFLAGGTALARGRGERLTPIDVRSRISGVLYVPDVRCSTAAVYSALPWPLTSARQRPTMLLDSLKDSQYEAVPRGLFNRLEESACAVEPRLEGSRRAFSALASPRDVRMTGSGSGLFCLTRTTEDASCLERDARARLPGGRIFPFRSECKRT